VALRLPRTPSLGYWVVGGGILLVFLGALVALSGSTSTTADIVANTGLAGRILAAIGALLIAGGGGWKILEAPLPVDDATGFGGWRYVSDRVIGVVLVIAALYVLVHAF